MPKKELQAFLTTKGFKDLQGLNADYFKCSLMLMKTTSIYKNKSIIKVVPQTFQRLDLSKKKKNRQVMM